VTIPFQILHSQIDAPLARQPQEPPFRAVGDAAAVPVRHSASADAEALCHHGSTADPVDDSLGVVHTGMMSRTVTSCKAELARVSLSVTPILRRMVSKEKPRHPFDVALGKRLRLVRRWLSLDQEEFALALGVSRTALSNYERGERPFPVHAAVRLRQRFGIPLDFIYCGSLAGVPHELFELAQRAAEDSEFAA